MRRGQLGNWTRLKSTWVLVLCAGLLAIGRPTITLAADGEGTGAASRPWENYFGVAMLPGGRAIVVGDKGVVMSSMDKGATWTRFQLTKNAQYLDLYSVAFTADGSRGWAVGDGGTIFRSDDRGTTWTLQN